MDMDYDDVADGDEPPCPENHTYLGDGKCRDSYGEYSIDAGNREPQDGRCNALLRHWEDRYGEKRYCGQLPRGHFKPEEFDGLEGEFCRHHNGRVNIIMRAKELLQHGAYSKTQEHLYSKLDSWEKLLCHGLHESLIADSVYEFAPEFEEREFDFSELDEAPDQVDGDGTLIVEIPRATEYIDRSKALWLAAVDGVKAQKVNAKIAVDEMEVETTEHAQLTSPTEFNEGRQEWKEIMGKKEHHLNLAYSRLVRDRKELLAYGGVATGTEVDKEENSKVIEEFTTVSADPESVTDSSGMVDIEAETDE